MRRPLILVAALMGLVHCGGESPVTPPTPTAIPTVAPTPTPTPKPPTMTDPNSPIYCVPVPPPIYGFRIKVHADFGDRKVLDSRVLVGRDASYCSAVGQVGEICVVRDENDPQAFTCNNAVAGKAKDTGRYGPTWYVADAPPSATGDFGWHCAPPQTVRKGERCKLHGDNQFMVDVFEEGYYTACTANFQGCSTTFVKWP